MYVLNVPSACSVKGEHDRAVVNPLRLGFFYAFAVAGDGFCALAIANHSSVCCAVPA
jgi:hypothetical protein